MARIRRKKRIEHLVDALEATQRAGISLQTVDLRTCGAELRQTVKQARGTQQQLTGLLEEAIRLDLPEPPTRTSPT